MKTLSPNRKFYALAKTWTSNSRYVYNFFFTLIILISGYGHIYSQSVYRRHFIIAYDISTPSLVSVKNCPEYQKALKDLFSNQEIIGFTQGYQNNLEIEAKNGVPFFDHNRDEISFFHFNVSETEISILRNLINKNNITSVVNSFNQYFIKDKKLTWTKYRQNPVYKNSVEDYFNEIFAIQPSPKHFGNGVSMSNFVYPLVLQKIDSSFAGEYVLVILSDFLTGSQLANTKDLDRVRDIFQVPYGSYLTENSPVNLIKSEIDYLLSQYYSINFFQFSFLPKNSSNQVGIIGMKIKPKVGISSPEDVALFIDGDLELRQQGYKSKYYRTNSTKLKFTHNKNLNLQAVSLKITDNIGGDGKVIFQNIIAQIDPWGKWKSDYSNDNKLMNFDSITYQYYIPKLKLPFDTSSYKLKYSNLKFEFSFHTKYEIPNSPPLNFLYSTDRTLTSANIHYSSKAAIIVMEFVIPVILVFAIIIMIFIYGKPRRILLNIVGYLDSFEKNDFRTVGKISTPYKAWDYTNQGGVDFLIVDGSIEYKANNFMFNWNSPINILLTVEQIPIGFEMFLKHDLHDLKEFAAGTPTTIKKLKNNKLQFAVGIRQTDITKTMIEPELVKFSVEAAIRDSLLLITADHREKLEYKFHLGADLRDVWVGFDPGTSGSCVAVGSSTDNIIIGEDKAKNKIIPSVLVFDKAENFHQNGIEVPEKIYKHGTAAQTLFWNKRQYQGFQSIKKLLGFRDIKEIKFDNKNVLALKGKDLAGLLVKGLFKDINTYFNRPDFNAADYKRDGKFNPLRAVVAIPNNFTTSKIQDMVDCIANLNQFKEIRYVYEAEAVLFYYLSNFSQFSGGEAQSDSETILVFDMGGSTINATIVTANKTLFNGRPKYEIDFLGKIGYGIGGDTIDYCITKFLLTFSNEIPQFGGINIFDRKVDLAKLAFQIKKEIIANYNSSNNFLITYANLENFINKALGTNITIDPETSEMYKYFVKDSGKFKLFEHQLFIKTIYNNIKDAVNEVVELSEGFHIDRVIFSGRSTSFPMIKETVEKQLNAKKSGTKIISLNLEESKMAVAKGACWYGINKNSVRLNNLKTNAAFGFKKTQSADKTDVRFYELVSMGSNFDTSNDDIDSFQGVQELADDFAFDGAKVNFYQIMGKNADKILSEDQKHKFSKIATINLDQLTSKIAMKVNENDEVECAVILQSNRPIKERGVVADQEIDEANEEHYTWIVK